LDKKHVLGVGVATLDLINTVATYPPEDAEVRAQAQRRACGGNCANTLTVLADLGHACTWSGTLANDAAAGFVRAHLEGLGIDCTQTQVYRGRRTPTSFITLSLATGSRTIVHYRDLPELDAAAFARVPLGGLDWIHFEGRNPSETALMLRQVRRDASALPISLELEKPRPGIESLLDGPDLLLIARGFALALGSPGTEADPGPWLRTLAEHSTARILVLGWGAAGAWLLERGGHPHLVPAHPPAEIHDTLGAGDTQNAGMIDGLLRGLVPLDALRFAVTLAGLKCGRPGLAGLGAAARAAGIRAERSGH
jgi:ketohexokinase